MTAFTIGAVILGVALLGYLLVDWRRSSRLKRDLAAGTATDARHDAPDPDARRGIDAHTHQTRSQGNQSHGTGYL